jgi:hypothetical protein
MELYRPWSQKDWKELEEKEGRVGGVGIGEANVHYRAYSRMLAFTREKGLPLAIFMVPRNDELYGRYDLVDRAGLERCQADLGNMAKGKGAAVFDYTWRVPDQEFVDLVHLTREGNERVGSFLVRDLDSRGILPGKLKNSI